MGVACEFVKNDAKDCGVRLRSFARQWLSLRIPPEFPILTLYQAQCVKQCNGYRPLRYTAPVQARPMAINGTGAQAGGRPVFGLESRYVGYFIFHILAKNPHQSRQARRSPLSAALTR